MVIPDCSLSYFYCDKTTVTKPVQDYRDLPRPHSAITYIIAGYGEIISEDRRDVIRPGDLMFTPMGARYTQVWDAPHYTSHISCRFIFRKPPYPFAGRRLYVQKLSGLADTLPEFEYVLNHFTDSEAMLDIMSKFYALCRRFAPKLDGCDLPPPR